MTEQQQKMPANPRDRESLTGGVSFGPSQDAASTASEAVSSIEGEAVSSDEEGAVSSTQGAAVSSTQGAAVSPTQGAAVSPTQGAAVSPTQGAAVSSTEGAAVSPSDGGAASPTPGGAAPATRTGTVPSTQDAAGDRTQLEHNLAQSRNEWMAQKGAGTGGPRDGDQASVDLTRYAGRPIGFMLMYVWRHRAAHISILLSVVIGVACSVSASFASKLLVNALQGATTHPHRLQPIWNAVTILLALIATDNLAWRVGGWISTKTFVQVTGDLRRDLFRHLTGHSPSYFADRMPGTLAGRITATANAIFTVENLFTWNVLPPMLAVLFSIGYMAGVRWWIALGLVILSGALSVLLFRLAAAGRALHHQYAIDAAQVDGELLDVINNMPLVRAFGAGPRERRRFSTRLDTEMGTRTKSLRYLEKLRLLHAVLTAALTAGLLVVSVILWIHKQVSTGDIVMITSLGFTILHGTRDLAVALVETIQHIARLSEALGTLLLPHDMPDDPDARGFASPARGAVEFRNVTYAYPGAGRVLDGFNLDVQPGQRVGLVGRSGSGKTTVLALLQRLRFVQAGEIILDGSDLRKLSEEALRSVISVVPQDVSLFHRSVLENIRYGKPDGRRRGGLCRRRRRRLPRTSSTRCRRGSRPRWATAASSSRAASASASRSRARSCATRRSCCSTRPPRRSTARASTACRRRSTG